MEEGEQSTHLQTKRWERGGLGNKESGLARVKTLRKRTRQYEEIWQKVDAAFEGEMQQKSRGKTEEEEEKKEDEEKNKKKKTNEDEEKKKKKEKEEEEDVDVDACPECGQWLCVSEEGFSVCPDSACSRLYRDRLDQTAEWRHFMEDGNGCDPARCGMPTHPFFPEMSFGYKVLANGKNSLEMQKIRRHTDWMSMSYRDKTQCNDFQFIHMVGQSNGLNRKITDDAVWCYRSIMEHGRNTFRGENREGIIAASIYISCRKNGIPRTPREVAKLFNLDLTHTTKGCKIAMSMLSKIETDLESHEKMDLGKMRATDFLQRYGSKLNLDTRLVLFCHFLSHKIQQNEWMTENAPHSIAAGILQFVCYSFGLSVGKKQISEVCETSEVTINKCFRKLQLLAQIHKLIPESLLQEYQKE